VSACVQGKNALNIVTTDRADSLAMRSRAIIKTGITLIEILVAVTLFILVVTSALVLFRKTIGNLGAREEERLLFAEATTVFSWMESRVGNAVINELTGPLRMNFIGTGDSLRWICPLPEGEGSDMGKFGLMIEDATVKVCYDRIAAAQDDFSFSGGFPGAQPLAFHIEHLHLSYGNSGAWETTWDTSPGAAQEGRLPDLLSVEVTVAATRRNEGKLIERTFTKLIRMANS